MQAVLSLHCISHNVCEELITPLRAKDLCYEDSAQAQGIPVWIRLQDRNEKIKTEQYFQMISALLGICIPKLPHLLKSVIQQGKLFISSHD